LDLERDSKAYVDKVAPGLFRDWDPVLILAEAGPDILNLANENRTSFEMDIQVFKEKVGPLLTSKGATMMGKPEQAPDGSVAMVYAVDGIFLNGISRIILPVYLRNGYWKIGLFGLDPQAEEKRTGKPFNPNP
jgi:hypothetical protein